MLANAKSFQKAYFERMELKDTFLKKAHDILHNVKTLHIQRHTAMSESCEKVKPHVHYIYIGIHSRRTDHLEFQKKNGFKELDARYYLKAMHLYRLKFKRQSQLKKLIFVFVSDDLQWGKDNLEDRNKERDLYFGGSGLPNITDAIGTDFALLSICNHTIESHGSFSYHAGAFAGGFKIKPNHMKNYQQKRYGRNPDFIKGPFDRTLPRLSQFII